MTYADLSHEQAINTLQELLDTRSDNNEQIDRLAEYLGEIGTQMCADAGYLLPINYGAIVI